MTDPVELFLARAKSVRLEPQEKDFLYSSVRARCPDRHTSRMTESPDEFVATARDVSLSAAERRTMFESVRSYMDANPVRTRSWNMFPFVTLRFSVGAFAALFLVSVSGISVYAAEYALPGDSLYSLKVDIVEPLVDIASFSPEAKARWAARRVERRLEEAHALMDDAAFNTERRVVLERRLQAQADALEKRLHLLQETQQDEVAAEEIAGEIEVVLEAHQELFAADGDQSTESFIDHVEAVRIMAGSERERLGEALVDASEVEMNTFAADRIESASDVLREAQLLAVNASDEEKIRTEEKLAEASRYMTSARTLLADGDERQAFAAATEAGYIARKLVVFLESSEHTNQQENDDVDADDVHSDQSVSDTDDVLIPVTGSASVPTAIDASGAVRVSHGSGSSVATDEQEAVRTREKVRDQIQRVRTQLREQPHSVVEHLVEKGEEVQQEGERAFQRGEYIPAQERFREAWRTAKDAEDLLRIDLPILEKTTASGDVNVSVEALVR